MGIYTENYLWSKRYSPAQGYYWKREREVTLGSASQWLAAYQKDEPEVTFVTGKQKPRY